MGKSTDDGDTDPVAMEVIHAARAESHPADSEGNASTSEEVDITGDRGVLKRVLSPGSGWLRAETGDEIVMHYKGRFEDGTVFDSSYSRGQPFRFKLGKGSVIKGWDVVTATMSKGEKAEVKLQPEYGYGGTGSPPRVPPNAVLVFDMELITWISTRDVFGDGRVIKSQLEEGTGWERPSHLAEATVHVSCTLQEPPPQRKLFDGEVTFHIGDNTVPLAWEKVVEDMKLDAVVRLRCYDDQVAGPGIDYVPSDAKVVEYDLKLLKWLKVDDILGDRSVMKKILHKGEGWETPSEGALATVKIAYRKLVGEVPGDVFEEHDLFMFKISDGAVVDGLDMAIWKMKDKERAIVRIKAPYAFGSAPNMCPAEVSVDDDLEVEVELLSIEKTKDSWSMSFEEKLEEIKLRKDKGNELFKAGRVKLAKRHYGIATSFFEYSTAELTPQMRKQVNALVARCHLNLAACYDREQDIKKVLQNAKKALDLEPSNVKALYRRGCAYMKLDNNYKAEADFKHALELDPSNQDIHRRLRELSTGMARRDQRERSLYSKMFSKLGE